MNLPKGQTLKNDAYKIINYSGYNGFENTYTAFENVTNLRVIIKELFIGDICKRNDDNYVTITDESRFETFNRIKENFISDANNFATLKHPNILPVLDIFEENGTAYYVIGYVDGETLTDYILWNFPLSERTIIPYFIQICEAIEVLHSEYILHLDIRPENILITKNHKAVLCGFGLGNNYELMFSNFPYLHNENSPAGFFPKEQMLSHYLSFSPATDIYALGATLYKCITSLTPPNSLYFDDTMLKDALKKSNIMHQRKIAIYNAMKSNTNDRYQTIKKLIQAVKGIKSDADGKKIMYISPEPAA